MNVEEIYAKTEKGLREMTHRSGELSYRQRRVLILMDGSQTVAAIQKKLGLQDEAIEVINFLVAQGYAQYAEANLLVTDKHSLERDELLSAYQLESAKIEQSPPIQAKQTENTGDFDMLGTLPESILPGTNYWIETDEVPVRSLEQAKLMMRDLLEQYLPRQAMIYALRVEKCTNAAQLMEYVMECQPLVKKARGKATAEEFVQALIKRIPL